MRQIERISSALRLAMSEGHLPKDANVDKLTATALAMGVLQKFYEGYYGDALKKNIDKAGELRKENAAKYQAELGANGRHLGDLRGIANDMRVVEALTGTDLALGLAWTRAQDTQERDNTPEFTTDLLDPAFTTRTTVDSLTPIESRSGVKLSDVFLRRRAETENLQYTSFEATDGFFGVENWELGLNFTHEMKLKDKYGQLQKAAYQMGVAARRTRALTLLWAAVTKAPRLVLPAAANGPDLTNLQAVVAYLGDMNIDGTNYAQTMTDLFLSGAWATTANSALGQAQIAVSDGQNISLKPNPVFQAVEQTHNEQIFTLAPWTTDWASTGLDRKMWLAVDRSAKPFEFATLRGFESGPRTLTEVPHTVDLDLGSFDNHLFRIKVSDYVGGDVANPAGVLLVPGTASAPEAYEG